AGDECDDRGDRAELLLSSRERMGIPRLQALQAHRLNRALDPRGDFGRIEAEVFQRKGDVVDHGWLKKLGSVVLQDRPDEPRKVADLLPRGVVSFDLDPPGKIAREEVRDNPIETIAEARFSGPRGTCDQDGLASGNLEVHPVERRFGRPGVRPRDILERYEGHAPRAHPIRVAARGALSSSPPSSVASALPRPA